MRSPQSGDERITSSFRRIAPSRLLVEHQHFRRQARLARFRAACRRRKTADPAGTSALARNPPSSKHFNEAARVSAFFPAHDAA